MAGDIERGLRAAIVVEGLCRLERIESRRDPIAERVARVPGCLGGVALAHVLLALELHHPRGAGWRLRGDSERRTRRHRRRIIGAAITDGKQCRKAATADGQKGITFRDRADAHVDFTAGCSALLSPFTAVGVRECRVAALTRSLTGNARQRMAVSRKVGNARLQRLCASVQLHHLARHRIAPAPLLAVPPVTERVCPHRQTARVDHSPQHFFALGKDDALRLERAKAHGNGAVGEVAGQSIVGQIGDAHVLRRSQRPGRELHAGIVQAVHHHAAIRSDGDSFGVQGIKAHILHGDSAVDFAHGQTFVASEPGAVELDEMLARAHCQCKKPLAVRGRDCGVVRRVHRNAGQRHLSRRVKNRADDSRISASCRA